MAMGIDLLTKPVPRRKPPEERMTFQEYCSLLNEDQKANLIHGVLYMESPASFSHERLQVFLIQVLGPYVQRKRLGIVLGSHTAIKLSSYDGLEPDLLFVSEARRHIITEQHVEGAPDMVAEIVSPSSRLFDRGEKMSLYAEHGVKEYWLIDPYRQTAEFLRNEKGQWVPLPVDERGVFRSEVIPGFWLRVDWLFAEELPDILETVTTILETSP